MPDGRNRGKDYRNTKHAKERRQNIAIVHNSPELFQQSDIQDQRYFGVNKPLERLIQLTSTPARGSRDARHPVAYPRAVIASCRAFRFAGRVYIELVNRPFLDAGFRC